MLDKNAIIEAATQAQADIVEVIEAAFVEVGERLETEELPQLETPEEAVRLYVTKFAEALELAVVRVRELTLDS